MRRVLMGLAAAIVLVVAAAVALFASAFVGNSAMEDGAEVAPGVHLCKDGFVGLYLLDAGPGAVALVDAGNDRSGGALQQALARRGLRLDAVKAVFLTHGHGDHLGALPLLPRAEVFALAAEEPLIEGQSAGHSPMAALLGLFGRPHPTGLRATRQLHDGEAVTVGDLSVRAFSVPGHTAGSAVFLARGVLFLGDSAAASREGAVRPAPWAFSDDPAQNVSALKALAGRLADEAPAVKALAFGHTGPLPGYAALATFGRPD